jgi:hypothetical protein
MEIEQLTNELESVDKMLSNSVDLLKLSGEQITYLKATSADLLKIIKIKDDKIA